MIVALRKQRQPRHDARAGRGARGPRRRSSPSAHADEVRRLEELFLRLEARSIERRRGASRRRSSRAGGAPSGSSGRATRRTATTRRTSRSGSPRPAAPRELAQELARPGAEWPDVERAEIAGRASSTSSSRPTWFAGRAGEISLQGGVRRRLGGEPPESVEVELVSANPTGPMTVARRATERTATRSRGCSSSRPRGRARVLLQRRGRADGAFRPPSTRAARGEPSRRTATRASTSTSSRRVDGDPVPADAGADRADARALPHPCRPGAPERPRAAASGRPAAPRHLRDGRGALGTSWARRRQGPGARPLAERAALPTYRAADALPRRQARSRASSARSTSSAPTTRDVAKLVRRASADVGYDPESGRGAALPARPPHEGRRGDEDGQALAATSCSSTILDEIGVDAARWYLVSRGHDQTIEIDIDLGGGELAEESGLLRPVRACPDRRDPPQRRRRGPEHSDG